MSALKTTALVAGLVCIALIALAAIWSAEIYEIMRSLRDPPPPPPTPQATIDLSKDLSSYLRSLEPPYREPIRHFTQEDVPELLAMLDDPWQSPNWRKIASVLGYIDKEQQSVGTLILFIQRGEDWESLPLPLLLDAMLAKADAIRSLGFIGGDPAIGALRLLITEEGLDQFLSEWIHDGTPGFPISRRTHIRGQAALGLVYTQDPENIRLVDELYQSVLPQVRAIDRRPGTGSMMTKYETAEERYQCKLYLQLLTALATRDFIEDKGMEGYKSRWRGRNMSGSAMTRYLVPYYEEFEEQ